MLEQEELTSAGKEEELMGRIQMDRMFSEKDDKIQEQNCLIEELRCQVAVSLEEELMVRTQMDRMLSVKDVEI